MSTGPLNSNDELAAVDPLIGVTLDNRFRIVSMVGKGMMGKVYRAVQMPLNRPVALKVLDSNRGVGRDATFMKRFLVEAALTAKLSHPNTVRVLDYGATTDGISYLAMEYLEGQTLEKALKAGPMSWKRTVTIGLQMARALREAHSLGVVHRDFKPANIMLLDVDDGADHAKVLDFGLVKSFVEGQELEGRVETQQGMLMGSPPYMAPEQGERNRADPRSDIYSLGAVLFECLQGRPPFVGRAPLEIIMKHVHDPVPAMVTPEGLEPIPPEVEAFVRKCLEKSPMDRYDSMDEVLAALGAIAAPLSSLSSKALEPVQVTAPLPQLAPQPKNVALLVVGFILAMAVGVVVTALATRSVLAKPAPNFLAMAAKPIMRIELPKDVVVHVETEPVGVTVKQNKKVVGVTPLEFTLPPDENGSVSAELSLSKDGYVSLSVIAQGKGPRLDVKQKLSRVPETVHVDGPPQVEPLPTGTKPKKPVKKTPASKLDELDDPLAPQKPPPVNDLKRPTSIH